MFNRSIEEAHSYAVLALKQGGNAIDATMGNGNDTLFLAQLAEHVYAFDIQADALQKTQALLDKHHINNVDLILDSHVHMIKYIKKPIQLIVFNLGYLPNSDTTIKTQADTTSAAIKEALKILDSGGYLVLTLYIGHDEGVIEAEAVEMILKTLHPKQFTVKKTKILNRNKAPFNIIVYKHTTKE